MASKVTAYGAMGGSNITINPIVVFEYANEYDENTLQLLELIQSIAGEVNVSNSESSSS